MTAFDFHQALYGEHIPTEGRELYKAYEESQHCGISDTSLSLPRFQAALVLALYQIKQTRSTSEYIYLVVPKVHEPWTIVKFGSLAGAAFKIRRGDTEGVRAVRDMFRRIRVGTKPFLLNDSCLWSAFGFSHLDPLPSWMSPRLKCLP